MIGSSHSFFTKKLWCGGMFVVCRARGYDVEFHPYPTFTLPPPALLTYLLDSALQHPSSPSKIVVYNKSRRRDITLSIAGSPKIS